jgi:hypothetical protein
VTYLQLINKVLTRLRLDTVGDLSESYTLLIGQFVNQAKDDVEGEGPWKALRTEITQSTANGTSSYTLTGPNERSYLHVDECGRPQAFETTSGNKGRIQVIGWEDMRTLHESDNNPQSNRPSYVAFNKTASGITARFFPTPDAIYSYKFVFVVPQDELSSAGTSVSVPSRPVWMLAAAYAAKERGQEIAGSDYKSMMDEADRALREAVLLDYGAERQAFYPD